MKHINTIGVVFASVWIFACGGAQEKDAGSYDCQEVFRDVIATPEEKTCGFAALEQFEMQVFALRKDCNAEFTPIQQNQLGDKLTKAQKCTEIDQVNGPKRRACENKVADVVSQKDCLQQACADALTQLKQTIEECSDPAIDGAHMTEAKQLVSVLEERVEEGDRLKSLVQLKESCDRWQEKLTTNRAMAIVEDITRRISQTAPIYQPQTSGSQMEASVQSALQACEPPLRASVKWIAEDFREELDSKEIRGSKSRSKRRLKRLEKQYKHLAQADADSLFAEISAPLTDLMEAHNFKTSIRPAGNAATSLQPPAPAPQAVETAKTSATNTPSAQSDADDPKPTAASNASSATEPESASSKVDAASIQAGNPFANAAGESSGKALSPKCKKLQKKVEHYDAKVDQYNRKNNASKAKAYEKKRDKAQQKFDDGGCS
ncbi:MAG: hypothetical protein JXR76_30560 [Deltaproteobacteria bacterium]|nr:hypothetical protein [Deltaproteobacteria bacterium]